jgi:hypothetical protein
LDGFWLELAGAGAAAQEIIRELMPHGDPRKKRILIHGGAPLPFPGARF